MSQATPDSEPGPASPIADDPWFGMNFLDKGVREALRRDPHPLLAHLREVQPVFHTPLGLWQISRYADVLHVLREAPVGVRTSGGEVPGGGEMPAFGPGEFMLSQDPPDHTRIRKLVSKAFTPRAIEGLRPRARELARGKVAEALERGSMDVIEELALTIPATLICEMLGVPAADRATFTDWTSRSTHLLTAGVGGGQDLDDARDAAMQLAAYFEALIIERRSCLSDDLLSQLIRAEEAGDRLSEVELLSQSIGLLIAGFETTIGLIGNGVLALLRHPDQLLRLRAEPSLIGTAVEECLRYEGPINLTIRMAHDDFELGGKRIPRDAMLMLLLAGANRDSEVFEAPDRFDIARDPNPHLAFGGGAHLCLGSHLARMEAQEAIGALVSESRVLELACDEDALEYGPSLFRVLARLPVSIVRRSG